MSECSTCSQYLSPEDMIRSSVRCSANGSVSIIGALLNQDPPAQPSEITGDQLPVMAASKTYSVVNVAGVDYAWTVPSGWTITAGQGTNQITVTVGYVDGYVSVTPSNDNGNGTARTLAVWTTPNFVYRAVTEDRARTANREINFTGTVRTVGAGKTYATLNAAYTAAASGDILEVYGTLDGKDETGGTAYFYFGHATKRILVRGATSNPADTVLTQTGTATWCVRIETGAETVFQNLTITRADRAYYTIYNGSGYSTINVFKNCIISNTFGSGNAACFVCNSGTREALTKWIEFDGCTISAVNADMSPLYINQNGANTQYLLTNCTLSATKTATFWLSDTNTCKLSMYNTVLSMSGSAYVFISGAETVTSAIVVGQIDIRECEFNYTGAGLGHACLIGRGANFVYFINNKINQGAVNSASAGGLTIKSQSAQLSDCVFKGNKVIAPRSLVLNQCKYVDVSENVFINNENHWEPILVINGTNAGEYTRYNSVKDNQAYGITRIIRLDTNAVAETAKDSALTCEITLNKYCTDAGYYANNDITETVQWADRVTFWGSDFDQSKMFTGIAQPT